MNNNELHIVIEACKKKDAKAQRRLFHYMYEYGMRVSTRFGNSSAETEDIANEGFYKVLNRIDTYNEKIPFLLWVRRIIINCAIDHYRKKRPLEKIILQSGPIQNSGQAQLESEYLMEMVKALTPQYRMVFILHAIEGFSHDEIAQRLNITKGTSKSNLSKARKKLQEMLSIHNQNEIYVRK